MQTFYLVNSKSINNNSGNNTTTTTNNNNANNNNNNSNNNSDGNNNNNNINNNNNNNNNNPCPWNFRVGVWQRIVMSQGQVKRSLAMIGNHLEMVSQKKCWWWCNLTIN